MHESLSAASAALLADLSDEMRAETEAMEHDLAVLRLRRRTIAEALTEMVHRGDSVTVHGVGDPVTGTMVHAGGDLAAVSSASGSLLWVVVGRGVTISTSGRPSARGRAIDRAAPKTIKGLLRRFEVSQVPARLVLGAPPAELKAVVQAVAVDHVVADVAGETTWLLPIESVLGLWDPEGTVA